jgi:hypothetical protein
MRLFTLEDNPDLEDEIYAPRAEIRRVVTTPYQIVDAANGPILSG